MTFNRRRDYITVGQADYAGRRSEGTGDQVKGEARGREKTAAADTPRTGPRLHSRRRHGKHERGSLARIHRGSQAQGLSRVPAHLC